MHGDQKFGAFIRVGDPTDEPVNRAATQPPVPTALDELTDQINRLDQAIVRLSNAVDPVLAFVDPNVPTDSTERTADSACSELVRRLNYESARLNDMINFVHRTTDRVEL